MGRGEGREGEGEMATDYKDGLHLKMVCCTFCVDAK